MLLLPSYAPRVECSKRPAEEKSSVEWKPTPISFLFCRIILIGHLPAPHSLLNPPYPPPNHWVVRDTHLHAAPDIGANPRLALSRSPIPLPRDLAAIALCIFAASCTGIVPPMILVLSSMVLLNKVVGRNMVHLAWWGRMPLLLLLHMTSMLLSKHVAVLVLQRRAAVLSLLGHISLLLILLNCFC